MKTKAIKWLSAQIRDDTCKADIDIIEFCKKCVKSYEVEQKNNENEEYVAELFNKFYDIYARKGSKVQAYKTFRKKLIKLKTKEEILEKARKIAKLYSGYAHQWRVNGTETQFIPLCSSWLNSNVPD